MSNRTTGAAERKRTAHSTFVATKRKESPPLALVTAPTQAREPSDPIYRDGDCRPDDPDPRWDHLGQPKISRPVEFVIVGGAGDIRFAAHEDAAYALALLRKSEPTKDFKIIERPS